MLLLSRAAWSSLCLAVVAMAAELTQDQVSWTRREGENVSFRCTNTDQCGYFTVDVLTFGRGTTLVVTDRPVERPKVSVYPATGADLKGRRSLLCVARDMVPEEVRFSWRRRGGGGVGGKDGEQLELRGPTYAASILVIDQRENLTDPYICRVEHESDLKEEIPAGVPGSLQVLSRARLASVLYTVMVVKSVLCCCGLALLLLHTNKTSRTPSRPTQNQHHHSPGLRLLSPRTSTTTALD
ncbi:unnamed protein product [Arctogadus glacialis]